MKFQDRLFPPAPHLLFNFIDLPTEDIDNVNESFMILSIILPLAHLLFNFIDLPTEDIDDVN